MQLRLITGGGGGGGGEGDLVVELEYVTKIIIFFNHAIFVIPIGQSSLIT